MESKIVSTSPAQTLAIGEKLGRQLKGGEVVAVTGPLGSGKTHLIKGIAHGAAAVDCQRVNSPTFVIINQYTGTGPLTVYHVDAYRLGSLEQFEMLGFDDLLSPDSVVLIEWADKVADVLHDVNRIDIELRHAGRTKRIITVVAPPDIAL